MVKEVSLREVWKDNLLKLESQETENVTWHEALEILLDSNIDIATSNMEIYRAENELKFVYRELIPKLTLKGGYSDFINGATSIFASGWTYGLDSFFNFAYLKEIPTRLYTSRLSLLRANTGKELKVRQVIIDLYKLYKEAEILKREEEFELWKDSFKKRLPIKNLGDIIFADKENDVEYAFEQKARELQLRLNDLLSDSNKIWKIEGSSLHELPYLTQGGINLEQIEKIAQNQIRLMAIELEGARLRGKEIDLRYWPDFNVSIATPSLFEFSGQSQSLWSSENIRIGADVIWAIDTRGAIKRDKDQFLKEREIQDKVLEKKIVSWILQLTKVNERLELIREEHRLQQKRWQIFSGLSIPSTMDAFSKRMQLLEKWWLTNKKIEKEMIELETTLWFFDDEQWAFLDDYFLR